MKRIETKRLILRKWHLSDSSNMFEYAQSPLVGPSAGWKPHKNETESKEIIKMFIKDNNTYAIELKSEEKVIGSIGIHKRFPDTSLKHIKQRELGYVLNPKCWGKGFMPEAVQAVIQFGFKQMNLELIWCAHFENNLKSKRVIEKCGFTYKFQKENALDQFDNIVVNNFYYCLSKDEYNVNN